MLNPTSAISPRTHAPSAALPLTFLLSGLAALAGGAIWLAARPDLLAAYHYNQNVIAVTHLFVLGWICTVVMGAMYQLVPVALETTLYSQRLAWAHYVCHSIGCLGMVWMFHVWNMKQVGHFGSALAFGVGLFVYNLARTLRRVPKWNVTATAIVAGLFWISLAVTAGLFIAIGKCSYDSTQGLATAQGVRTMVGGLRVIAGYMAHFDAISAMHAHAHLGSVGLFVILIVGVSYKLIPMFTLSEIQNRRRALGSIVLLNLGLAGSFVSILLRSGWKPVFAMVVLAALILYGWELRAILSARKRHTLDWGIRYFLTAVALLFPMAIVGLVLSWPGLPLNALTGQLENAYGFLGLVGVISFAILGMLYKILPFLVWFGRYSSQIGRARVPSLADMYSSRLQAIGYWGFLAGLAVASSGILWASERLVRFGCALLALAIGTFILNAALMLAHWVRPRVKPLALPVSPVQMPA